jgi:hypothetical protein
VADDESGATEPTGTNETPAVEAEPVEGSAPGTTWEPPAVEPESGIAIDGDGLPVNHRLRAERLADAGKDSDPGGVISDELIADAKERLERERKARPPVAANMKVADLERIAKREDIDLSSASNNAERVALIEAARGGGSTNEENA